MIKLKIVGLIKFFHSHVLSASDFAKFLKNISSLVILVQKSPSSILQQNRPVLKFSKILKFLEFSESRWSNDKPGLASKDTFAVKRGHYEVISLSRLFRIILFFKVSHSWLIFIARSTGSALELFFNELCQNDIISLIL